MVSHQGDKTWRKNYTGLKQGKKPNVQRTAVSENCRWNERVCVFRLLCTLVSARPLQTRPEASNKGLISSTMFSSESEEERKQTTNATHRNLSNLRNLLHTWHPLPTHNPQHEQNWSEENITRNSSLTGLVPLLCLKGGPLRSQPQKRRLCLLQFLAFRNHHLLQSLGLRLADRSSFSGTVSQQDERSFQACTCIDCSNLLFDGKGRRTRSSWSSIASPSPRTLFRLTHL